MKIRIKGNSVRIRLTRSEVEQLGKDGHVEESTVFGNTVFTYALQTGTEFPELSADFRNNTITMYVPESMAKGWTDNDTVGYSATIDNGAGGLFLLLEKDFKCIDAPVTEDQSDNYENPLMSCE